MITVIVDKESEYMFIRNAIESGVWNFSSPNFYKAMGQYCGAGTSEGSFTYTYIDRMNKHAMRNGVNIYDIINKVRDMKARFINK